MTNEERLQLIQKAVEDSILLRRAVDESTAQTLVDIANLISGVIGSGGKILICGNGGSASDSSHMATELVVRLTAQNNRQSLPAIALNADSSVLTAAGNDFGFKNIFARQIEGLGFKGDLLFAISTSGNSENIIKAVTTAQGKNIFTVALLGGNGGKLAPMVDKKIIVPHASVQRIQEEHIFLIHLLVELIESDLFG
jgi:D-sedoheptulose 7-phosphate isomerase